jgi:PAS domain S-box-containing protein
MSPDNTGFEESAEELFEHAPCGYLITHADGRIIRTNATLRSMVGRSADALSQARFQELLTVAGRIYYDTHVRPLLAMQGFVHEIAFDLQATGDRKLVSVVLNAVQTRAADGQPQRLRILVFDATSRRQYERELLHARRIADEARETERALPWQGYPGGNSVRVWRTQREIIVGVMRGEIAPEAGLDRLVKETNALLK